jgi:hypothetical protein
MRRAEAISSALLLLATPAFAQTTPPAKAWSFFASAYTYIIPSSANYVQPTFSADRDRLHLEARYNYEAQKTGSTWFGWNFSGGDSLEWELTPIVGAVFGEVEGVAPGYKASIAWRRLALSSESEYVIDSANTSDSFLYNWSELTYDIKDSFRAGLVVQRTRAYQTERDVQRGVMAGYSYRGAEFALYLFNPDADKPTTVFSVGFRF